MVMIAMAVAYFEARWKRDKNSDKANVNERGSEVYYQDILCNPRRYAKGLGSRIWRTCKWQLSRDKYYPSFFALILVPNLRWLLSNSLRVGMVDVVSLPKLFSCWWRSGHPEREGYC
jgi:hypothetical protein